MLLNLTVIVLKKNIIILIIYLTESNHCFG